MVPAVVGQGPFSRIYIFQWINGQSVTAKFICNGGINVPRSAQRAAGKKLIAHFNIALLKACLLYTSDAADD